MLINLAELMARKARTAKRQMQLVPPTTPAPKTISPDDWPVRTPGPGAWSGRREEMAANRAAVMPKGGRDPLVEAYRGESATGAPFENSAARRVAGASGSVSTTAAPQDFASLQQQRDAVMQERLAWGLRHPILSGNKVAQRLLGESDDWYAGREKSGEGIAGSYLKMGLAQPEGGLAGRRITEPGVYDPLRQAMDEERTILRKRQMAVDRLAILNASDVGKRLSPSIRYRILTEDRPDPDLMVEVPRAYEYVNRDGFIMQRDPITGVEKKVGAAPGDPSLNQPASISGRQGWTDAKGQFHQFRNPAKSADDKSAEQSAKDLKAWEKEYRALEAQANVTMPKLDQKLVAVAGQLKAVGFTSSTPPAEQARLVGTPGIATLIAEMKSLIRQKAAWQMRLKETASRRPGGPQPGRGITTGQPAEAQEPGVWGGEPTQYGQLPGGAANFPADQTGAQPAEEGEMAAPEVEMVTDEDVVNYAISLAKAGLTPEQAYQELYDMAVESGNPDPDESVSRIMAQVADQFETQ